METQKMNMTNCIVAIGIGLTFASLPTVVTARSSEDKPEAGSSTVSHESSFACVRLALDAGARRRHFEELGPALRTLKESARELQNVYEFRFPSGQKTIALVAEWAAGERLCCPFFDIQRRMEREGGPFWMRLTGRRGTKDFIKADAAARIKH
jgi:hypothetical protein